MKKILETGRLIWREYGEDDGAFMLELLNSPGWIAFIGDRNVHTIAEAKSYIFERLMPYYQKNGYGFLVVTLKDTNETPIGICGFIKRAELEHVDFGFAFLPQYMGMGYAFEISEKLLPYAKTDLKVETLLAITTLNNIRSIKLLEKLGFSFDKTIDFDGEELRLYVR